MAFALGCGASPPRAAEPSSAAPVAPGRPCPAAPASVAPTTAYVKHLPGRSLPLTSSGQASGDQWILTESGFVGAYLVLPEAATVRLAATVAASSDSVPPIARLSVSGHTVEARLTDAQVLTLETPLPAGTHLVRLHFTNGAGQGMRELHIAELSTTQGGLMPNNTDALALQAANTYIQHYRRGPAKVQLNGATPGETVTISQTRNEFGFGTNIPYGNNRLLPATAEAESEAARYQRMVLENFDTVVLSNGGKWIFNEPRRGQPQTDYLDAFLSFAEAHQLRARMHTMLWDVQQPSWVHVDPDAPKALLANAAAGQQAAKNSLRDAISKRIRYYIQERAARYAELDLLNESLHKPLYRQAFGDAGLAAIFAESAAAAKAGGGSPRLCLNEYNVLQWSRDPASDAADPAGNWYLRHADALVREGAPLGCLGVQYYADGRSREVIGQSAHSPARIAQALANLATAGLPLTLTEFSVHQGRATPERAAEILDDTMRLTFGSPDVDAFLIWAIWAGAAEPVPASVLFDAAGNLTVVGQRYQALRRSWSTREQAQVATDGSIEFDGFYGDYEIAGPHGVQSFSHRAAGVGRGAEQPAHPPQQADRPAQ